MNAYHERYFPGNPTTSSPMLEEIFYGYLPLVCPRLYLLDRQNRLGQ